MQIEECKAKLDKLRQKTDDIGKALHLDALADEAQELHEEMAAPGFWDDMDRAQKMNQRLKYIETTTQRLQALYSQADDCDVLLEFAAEEMDGDSMAEAEAAVLQLDEAVEALHIETLLTGEYDHRDAILSLHAGAGGTEAQDWTSMLQRMYMHYCERCGYAVKLLDMLEGDEAGIKSVTFQVSGENAYGYLKAERGVHRLVRISPFDAAARRQTSFSSLDVMPVMEEQDDIEIRSEDIKVDTYRSGGAGGQHINKTDSAVRITHIPTGVVVACQNERSQIQNRETAMNMLRSKLAEIREREKAEKMAEIQGNLKKIEWGSQIRSYVFHPYSMVKDHRTGFETGDVQGVMDGKLEGFITAYLQGAAGEERDSDR